MRHCNQSPCSYHCINYPIDHKPVVKVSNIEHTNKIILQYNIILTISKKAAILFIL